MFTVSRLQMLTALLALAGCQGGEREQRADTAAVTTPPPEARTPAEKPAGTPGVTPGMIALGDSIFHGQAAGGTCFTCHGQAAKGTPMAPDLTDQQWLNADGRLESIMDVVTKGVPQPKEHQVPMPPMGGASLTPEQIRAVSGYVYSLSHGGA